MLHNMACHELALASTLFGVSVERVASVQLEPLTLPLPLLLPLPLPLP